MQGMDWFLGFTAGENYRGLFFLTQLFNCMRKNNSQLLLRLHIILRFVIHAEHRMVFAAF